MVRILYRGLEKSRHPFDLTKKQGGYGCVQSSILGDHESLYPHPITRQSSDLKGAAQGLNPLKPSEFRKLEISWTRDRENPS
jgi:hypothetical protein